MAELERENIYQAIGQNEPLASELRSMAADGNNPLHKRLTWGLRRRTPSLGRLEGLFAGSETSDPDVESWVRVTGRPSIRLRNGELVEGDINTKYYGRELSAHRQTIAHAAQAVGRIQFARQGIKRAWAGTGWLVDENIVVTTRSALTNPDFHLGLGNAQWLYGQSDLGMKIDFRAEQDAPAELEFKIKRLLYVEEAPELDIAFLEVDWGTGMPAQPLDLIFEPEGTEIAMVGHPAMDSRFEFPGLMAEYYGDRYNVKHLAPGEIRSRGLLNNVEVFVHDCSPMGNNTGAVIVQLSNGCAVGMHIGVAHGGINVALPASTIRACMDKGVADHRKVQFDVGYAYKKWEEPEPAEEADANQKPKTSIDPTPVVTREGIEVLGVKVDREETLQAYPKISASQARQGFAELVERAMMSDDRVVVERHNRGVAAIVPISDLLLLEAIEQLRDEISVAGLEDLDDDLSDDDLDVTADLSD